MTVRHCNLRTCVSCDDLVTKDGQNTPGQTTLKQNYGKVTIEGNGRGDVGEGRGLGLHCFLLSSNLFQSRQVQVNISSGLIFFQRLTALQDKRYVGMTYVPLRQGMSGNRNSKGNGMFDQHARDGCWGFSIEVLQLICPCNDIWAFKS